jgi:hypothetical protein
VLVIYLKNSVNVERSLSLRHPCNCGTNVVVICYGLMVGGSSDRRRSLGSALLHAENSSYFKIILCILYTLKMNLNIFIVLSTEFEFYYLS